jgi:hypothetical protein
MALPAPFTRIGRQAALLFGQRGESALSGALRLLHGKQFNVQPPVARIEFVVLDGFRKSAAG